LALASGYQAVPSLGNDMVTYMPVARKHFDDAYLLGDLPIRDADDALLAWGSIIRVLTFVFGFEGAFFAVSLLGGAILAYGIHRLVASTLGAGHRAGFLAAMVGMTLTFGGFGYTLSIPSHAAFDPTPRFLAIAISVVAISFVLERALVRGVVLGIVSTAVNTLDGLVPVGLAVLALMLAGDLRPQVEKRLAPVAKLLAMATIICIAVAFAVYSPRLPTAGVLARLLPGSLIIVSSGALIGLASWAAIFHRPRWRRLEQAHVAAAGGVLALGGIILASRRGSDGSGFVAGVRAFETVLVEVRQAASMIVLSATSVSSALIFCAIIFAGFALLRRPPQAQDAGSLNEGPERHARHAALALALLATVFVSFGSNLMERTSLPFLVTVWPVRVAWVVVLVFVGMLFARLHQADCLRRIGALPAVMFGLLFLQGPIVGRPAWSVGLLAASCVWVIVEASIPVKEFIATSVRRPIVQALALVAPVVVLVVLLARVNGPEIQIADSMDRIEQQGGGAAEVVQLARAANIMTPAEARILIPPDFEWGAFRLLSERGVAFEWKNFSTTQPLEWYRQLRWMCDPDYEASDAEDFVIGGADVLRCHSELSASEVRRVAEKFDADFAVVRNEIAHGMTVIGASDSGRHALVRLR
jgi:hypothetical protein